MDNNEFNGVNQQVPNYQNNGGYQQAPNYQNNGGYQQTPNYQNNGGYQQTPNYQNSAGYQQAPNYQNNGGYQQAPNYQNNGGFQQAPNYQNYGGYQQMPNYQNNMGNQQPAKAPNIFKQFAFSFVPPKYKDLARAKVGSMIWLIILLVFLLTGFSFLSMLAGYVLTGGVSEMLDLFPYFEVSDGEFSIDETFYVEEDDLVMYMTDDVDEFDYYDVQSLMDEGFTEIMLVGRYNICLYEDYEYQEMYFDEFGNLSFSKDDIAKWTGPFIWVVMLIIYVIWFVLRVFWYFLCAGVYLLIGMLLALIYGKKIDAGHIFKAAVFAKIPMFVLVSLFNMLPLEVSFPGFLRVLATLILFGFGVWFLPQKSQQYRQY